MKKLSLLVCLLATSIAVASGEIKKTQASTALEKASQFLKNGWSKTSKFAHHVGVNVGLCDNEEGPDWIGLSEDAKQKKRIEVAIKNGDTVKVRTLLLQSKELTTDEKKALYELSVKVAKECEAALAPRMSRGDATRLVVSAGAFALSALSVLIADHIFSSLARETLDRLDRRKQKLVRAGVASLISSPAFYLGQYQLMRGLSKHGRIERLDKAWAISGMLREELNPNIARI